jgi:very-short-patch-repair endonuclease
MSDGEHDGQIEETLVEMVYRWADVEEALPRWTRPDKETDVRLPVGRDLLEAVDQAFRVEAVVEEGTNDYGEDYQIYSYVLLFDVESKDARRAAQDVRSEGRLLDQVLREEWKGTYTSVNGAVRVCSAGAPSVGQVCGRRNTPPPKKHIDVSDVPVEKPNSNVPLTHKHGYWLTPIEVPFYDALRDTGLVFAVQPWIQGVERRYRADFLVFYDGGMVVVELDGHESHKSKEDRIRDAARDRWFAARGVQTLRWTGTEVHANAQECVRQLLEIVRGTQARP